MKDSTIIMGFNEINGRIDRMKRRHVASDQELVTLQLQMNSIMDVAKWIFPLKWILKYYMKKEFKIYEKQLDDRKKELDKLKQEIASKTKQPKVNTPNQTLGRNKPCHCGSGKKFKKCCLDKKDNIPTPTSPREIEAAMKRTTVAKLEEQDRKNKEKKVE